MKTRGLLILTGITIAGYGLYRYFKYQVDSALDYDYSLKDLHVGQVVGNNVTLDVTMSITNKSNFEVTLSQYDIDLYFKDIKFVNTKSNIPIVINPNSSFEFKASGVLDITKVKISIVPFLQDVLQRKPIDLQISGFLKITFLNIPTTIEFDKQTVNYSVDLLKEYKLDKGYEKLKAKYPKLFFFLKKE